MVAKILQPAGRRWLGLAIIFMLISWLHMGPSLTHCRSVVLGAPGDHTAGIMYNTWVHPKTPWQGPSGLTNYPYGENLWQPLALSSAATSTLFWLLFHLTNLVCGWNLLVLIGYMSSALSMYGFMYWLTKNSWVGFFAAYAVTFTPYHAFASHGQIAGLLGAIFTLALWQFADLWKKPNLAKAVRLGLIFALSFYTDGYFILIGGVMLAAFWLTALTYGPLVSRQGLKKFIPQLQALAIASGLSLLALLPLGWANLHYASQINSIWGAARGNIAFDAQTYSANLSMYFNQHSLLFLSFTVVALALIALGYFYRGWREKQKQSADDSLRTFVIWASLILSVLALWVSLKPIGHIWRVQVHNPSGLIIHLTASWRVFGRLYSAADLGIVTLAGLGLFELMRRHHKQRFWIMGLALLLVVIELRSFPATALTTTFNYRQVPPVYTWLHDNSNIKAVAEYPLVEPPQGAYLLNYYTFQEISGKPLLNSLLPNSPQAALRRSLSGINDPQSLPVLRSLGIGLVNFRPADSTSGQPDLRAAARHNPQLKQIFSESNTRYPIDSYLIKPGAVASYALVIPSVQYFQVSVEVNGQAKFMLDDNTVLNLVKLPQGTAKKSLKISFDVSADSPRPTTIVQNGTVLWKGTLDQQTQTIILTVSPRTPITVNNQKSAQPTHTAFSKLQVLN